MASCLTFTVNMLRIVEEYYKEPDESSRAHLPLTHSDYQGTHRPSLLSLVCRLSVVRRTVKVRVCFTTANQKEGKYLKEPMRTQLPEAR